MNSKPEIKIIECPRDAMQGIHDFIPTETKIEYINSLLKVGFDTIDFGSFVSPKAIPQLRDTVDVLNKLDLNSTKSKLLAIIANVRGAEEAVKFNEIKYLGFPFSVSETFQKKNTNSTIEESFKNVEIIQEMCLKHNKELVIYISMGFGNPYGDEWNSEIVMNWVDKMAKSGIRIIAMADTVGVAKPGDIQYIFTNLISEFIGMEFGAHLHCRYDTWRDKVDAAYQAGCRRFDVAIKGLGGCPMANDELTGNLATENLIQYLKEQHVNSSIDQNKLNEAMIMASKVFHYDFTGAY